MKKVTVLRLSGCSYCEELTSKLEARSVEFESVDADDNSDLADEIEDLLEIYVYPITVLESEGNALCYLFRASDYDQTRAVFIDNGIKKGFLTIDHLVEEIINFI